MTLNRVFSHDVTVAMFLYQNKGTAALILYQANPLLELNSVFMQIPFFVSSNQNDLFSNESDSEQALVSE